MPPLIQPRFAAVGAYIFAGGFSLGVKQAGFKILGHLEDGKFGVETAKANFQNLPIYVEPNNWPVNRFTGKTDFVYCNPPCSPWSTAGIVKGQTTEQQTDWKAHSMTQCLVNAFRLIETIQPTVWCFESVRQAYSRSGSMLDDMWETCKNLGYSVTDLFVEACDFGVPQHRKRYFMVASKIKIQWSAPKIQIVTVDDMLKIANQDNDMVVKMPTNIEIIADKIEQGKNARAVWDKMKKNGEILHGSRPAFLYDRMAADRPSYTLLGSCNKLHPHENRMLSVNETQVLCGFPPDYILVGSMNDRYAQLGKGVCPPVAKWLATQIRLALEQHIVIKFPTREKVTVSSNSILKEAV